MHAEPVVWSNATESGTVESTSDVPAVPAELEAQEDCLQVLVKQAVETYLNDLGPAVDAPNNGRLYELLLHRVELPLLQAVLTHVQQNQTRAARLLGLNRGTLRKKMQLHGLLDK